MNNDIISKLTEISLELGCMSANFGMILATMFTDDGEAISGRFPPEKMNDALASFLWELEHIQKAVEEAEEIALLERKGAKTA